MRLDFSKLSIQETIDSIDRDKAFDWQIEVLQFLENYQQHNCEIAIDEQQGENLFVISVQKQNIQKTALALNDYMELKEGDTTFIPYSIKSKNGVIALAQGIEAKMDVYFGEPGSDLKIPYTEQNPNEINWGLNYVYLNEGQVELSKDILFRIEKVAVESNGISEETQEIFNSISDQNVFEVFSVKSFPIAVKHIKETDYHLVGDIEINRSEKGQLLVDAAYFDKEIDTQKAVILNDDGSFRWLTDGEYLDSDSETIVNFDHIEEVLKPYIDTRFVVINFPDKKTGEEVVTLVVERRYMEEFNYPTEDLKEHEVPQQTYFLGEFPVNDDRAAIRNEVKRLLAE